MTKEKGLRPTSPVHVHVEDDIPVHVHVKQPKKKGKSSSANLRSSRPKLQRSTVSSRARSKTPEAGPWVPPPGKATKGSKVSWQGPTHRLEIHTPRDSLRMSDLSTDEEDHVLGQMKGYECKIDNLMTEVGTLKNEVELQKTLRDSQRKEEELNASRQVLEEQEQELLDYRDEQSQTERENRLLRKSMNMLHDEAEATRVEADILNREREKLMKKLIEVEMDGQAAGKQVSDLRDHIRKLRNRLRAELLDRERIIAELRTQIGAQREEVLAMSGLQSSLENTRGHLQKELRTKEADCNRMAVQIRTLESDNAQMKIEMDHLRDLVATAREKGERDKEALKKATRIQKQRAAQSEDRVEQLSAELLEKDTKIEDIRTQLEEVSLRLEKSVKERSQASAENTALKTRLDEVESLLERVDHNNRAQVEELTAELHGKTSAVGGLQLENERLKSSIATIETKFRQADEELLQLRSNLKHYEGLVDEYKSQMNQSRKEIDETMIELQDTKRHNEEIQIAGEEELEKKTAQAKPQVKTQLSTRLQELQPLPEMLKTTELKLHDTEDRLIHSERKNGESSKLIADLSAKVETLSEQLECMKEKYQSVQAEDRTMADKMMVVERRLQEAEDKNRDLLTTVARREEALHQNNLRLEDRERENASLTRQLENALTDIRRQQEQTRDKQAAKERTLQTRIVDLESQLSQTRAEIARVKREKEETERKFNSRLYDLKDRLEQSHSTNRSMQNYVQFLKNSYANVFGDSTMNMMSTTPVRSGFP